LQSLNPVIPAPQGRLFSYVPGLVSLLMGSGGGVGSLEW
jgi:hypothetical protein